MPEARRRALAGTDQTVASLVHDVARRLSAADDPEREAREIVAAVLDVPRHWPILHANRWLDVPVWRRARAAAAKRSAGAPMAYAVGRANFRNLTLDVDERVLIPRPETELLVDLVLKRCAPGGIAVDVGTGSGAIAIALATEGRFDRVVATDVSRDALDVARRNAERIGADVEFRASDLLANHAAPIAAVVSNPPYVTFDEARELPASVRDWEPAVALYSPHGGLALTARLVRQAADRLGPGGLLALEVDSRRASLVAELVGGDKRFARVDVQLDLAGRERFVLATRRDEEKR